MYDKLLKPRQSFRITVYKYLNTLGYFKMLYSYLDDLYPLNVLLMELENNVLLSPFIFDYSEVIYFTVNYCVVAGTVSYRGLGDSVTVQSPFHYTVYSPSVPGH